MQDKTMAGHISNRAESLKNEHEFVNENHIKHGWVRKTDGQWSSNFLFIPIKIIWAWKTVKFEARACSIEIIYVVLPSSMVFIMICGVPQNLELVKRDKKTMRGSREIAHDWFDPLSEKRKRNWICDEIWTIFYVEAVNLHFLLWCY